MFEPFGLERFFSRHEFSARYLLCTSDCESMSIDELLALTGQSSEALDALQRTWLGYTESKGSPLLREKIARFYRGLDPDSILVHSGAEEAILNLYLATVRPGDTVIVNWPCYQSLIEIPKGLGAETLKWKVREHEGRWFFDPDELEQLICGAESSSGRQKVKMLVLNMPHNPTGALMTPGEFNRVVDICRAREILLLVDEVYRMLELGATQRLPAVCEIYENAISLSVLSKAWGLAGLRIGWLATRRKDILDKVAAVKDYNSICASAPSETLACIALDHSDKILARNKAICEANVVHFKHFFERHRELFTWIPARAGSVAFPALLSAGHQHWHDAASLADQLLQETGALILPGALYGQEFGLHFRIGLGRRAVPEGLSVFSRWLEARGEN
ncbi:MAG: aminotransferase class I/II-fold pyridoxal phosphate-dependent enzyme [Rectinema sp.]